MRSSREHRHLTGPHLERVGRIAGQTVWIVSGEYVRNHIFLDFTQGGNDQVYARFTPRGEVWIDDATGPLDRTATLLHEIVERDQMRRKGLSYENAHDIALVHERVFRKELAMHPPHSIDLAAAAIAYQRYLKITESIKGTGIRAAQHRQALRKALG